eukprot:TRINITY_DN3125_c0_g1_i5.p1 TRINITY_DN3125_c0_g1~~TRINITY_DN3125_c0_g1_i5.p1  ORF type:complete len:480 (+),score=63.09 TRINITY_DN3125_c0_g1_i5:122-1561(+)
MRSPRSATSPRSMRSPRSATSPRSSARVRNMPTENNPASTEPGANHHISPTPRSTRSQNRMSEGMDCDRCEDLGKLDEYLEAVFEDLAAPRSSHDIDEPLPNMRPRSETTESAKGERGERDSERGMNIMRASEKVFSEAEDDGEDAPEGFYELTLAEAIQKPRWWWFAVTFGWCTTLMFVIGGQFAVIAADKDEDNSSTWISYAFPLIGNCLVGVWGPIIGYIASRFGLWSLGLMTIVSAQLLAVSCFIPGPAGLGFILFFYSLLNGFSFSLQFAYVTIAFPTDLYCPLLALSMIVQGAMGFVAWPILSPNPFGDTKYVPVVLLMLGPTFLCYGFPFLQRRNDAYRGNFLNSLLLRNNAVDLVHGYLQFDTNDDGVLDRGEVRECVYTMFRDVLEIDESDPNLALKVEQVVDLMFARVDFDGNGEIDVEELQRLATDPDYGKVCEEILDLVRSHVHCHCADDGSPLKRAKTKYSSHDND